MCNFSIDSFWKKNIDIDKIINSWDPLSEDVHNQVDNIIKCNYSNNKKNLLKKKNENSNLIYLSF